MKKTAFYDLDGTLTDPNEGITKCIQYALEKMDVDVPANERGRVAFAHHFPQSGTRIALRSRFQCTPYIWSGVKASGNLSRSLQRKR